MRADDDLLGATGQLHGDELLLVVPLERGLELGDDVGLVDGECLDIWSSAVTITLGQVPRTRYYRNGVGLGGG